MAFGEPVYSAFELIRDFGTRVTDRKCCCCFKHLLYAIRYPDGRGTVYLCSLCDLEPDKRAA